ncbi:MAG TPA: 4Fe-4S binding protein [Spirochaetota bacterium]|nr:4Fe-4S binding protein [Spirochaetota bacterium]
MAVIIDVDKCSGCGRCAAECPASAISMDTVSQKAVIDSGLCVQCGACISVCRTGAISETESTSRNTGICSGNPGGRRGTGGGRGASMAGQQCGGSGRGSGSSRGGGCGSGGGTGGNTAGECYCPLCGRVFPHKAGIPCSGSVCSVCGVSLVRK